MFPSKFSIRQTLFFISLSCAPLMTSSVLADCLTDFQAIVHKNLNSGPYQIEGKIHLTDGAKTYDIESLVKVDNAKGMSLHTSNPLDESEVDLAIVGNEGKVRRKVKNVGDWTVIPPEGVKSILETAQKNGFVTDKATNVQCLGAKDVSGKPYLAFQYDVPDPLTVTLYVDPKSQLPVFSEGQGEKGTAKAKSTMRYTFGSDIKIVMPQQ